MKRVHLYLVAVLIALVSTAFTKRVTNYFLVYHGTGNQRILSSYTAPAANHPFHLPGTGLLNWFRAKDPDNNGLSETELVSCFNLYNNVNPTANTLNDETSDIEGELDVKSDL